jgi:hypothetical protein
MERPDYPFDEFLRDMDEVHAMLEKEKRKSDAPEVEEDGSYPFEWTVIRVNEFMVAKYSKSSVTTYKAMRFVMMLHYVATHFSRFDREDFAVYGSPRVGGLVGEHLLHAVHQVFTAGKLPEKELTPDEMMKLAETFR